MRKNGPAMASPSGIKTALWMMIPTVMGRMMMAPKALVFGMMKSRPPSSSIKAISGMSHTRVPKAS